MPETKLGQKVVGWSPSAKTEFKTDLDKLTKVPLKVLRTVVDKIARTYPACNVLELVALRQNSMLYQILRTSPTVWLFSATSGRTLTGNHRKR